MGSPQISLADAGIKPNVPAASRQPTNTTFPLPISNGIIEHRKNIGSAIWLFIQLIDWTTAEKDGIGKIRGGKPVRTADLAAVLKLKPRQIGAQLKRLENGGYVRLKRAPYGHVIEVMKSKKFINRDRQKIADHPTRDKQKVADLQQEIGNNVPNRSAESCRCNKDITVDITKKSVHRKNRDAGPSESPDVRLIHLFAAKYHNQAGSSYPIEWSRDRKCLRPILSAGHTEAAVEANMDRYFADSYYRGIGFDIPGFAKAYPKLNSAGARQRHNYDEGAFPSL
jgi:DNA-binding MarR family transcriptional regulator